MQIIEASASLTRPADTTAYASGDLIANSTTAGSVTPLTFFIPYGRGLRLAKVNLKRSATSVTNASFRLHLYKDSPTVTNGDNSAWLSIEAGYQGSVDIVGTSPAFSDAAKATGTYVVNSNYAPFFLFTDADQFIYGLLEARGAYTPASAEIFTAYLIGEAYL